MSIFARMTPAVQQSLRQWAGLLFSLLALVLPLSVNTTVGTGGLTLLVPAEPLAGLLVLLFLVAAVESWMRKGLRLNGADRVVIAFWLAHVPGLCAAQYPLVSFKYFISITAWMAVGYGLPRLLHFSKREWVRAGVCLLASTLVLSLWVLKGILEEGISHEASYLTAQPFVPQGHTNLTAMIEPLFLLTLAGVFLTRKAGVKIFWLCAALLLFAMIDYSWSRSAFITSSISILLFVIWIGRARRKPLLWMLLFIVMLPVGIRKGYEMIFEKYYRIHSHYDPRNPLTRRANSMFSLLNPYSDMEKNSMNERLVRWRFAWQTFLERPLTGIGPGAFAEFNQARVWNELRDKKFKPKTAIALRKMNTHNLWISWMCEGGIFLLAAGLWLIAAIARALVHRLRARRKWASGARLLKLALAAYFLHFFIQAVFQDFQNEPRVILIFWAACALCLPWGSLKKEVPR